MWEGTRPAGAEIRSGMKAAGTGSKWKEMSRKRIWSKRETERGRREEKERR